MAGVTSVRGKRAVLADLSVWSDPASRQCGRTTHLAERALSRRVSDASNQSDVEKFASGNDHGKSF